MSLKDEIARPQTKNISIFEEIEILRKDNKHEQAILLAWGFIELIIDVAIIDEFHVGDSEETLEHREFIVRNTFDKKANFLTTIGYFTKEERKKIQDFQESRNKLVHDYLDTPFYFSSTQLDEQNKDKIIEQAIEAIRACEAGFLRNKKPIHEASESKTYPLY